MSTEADELALQRHQRRRDTLLIGIALAALAIGLVTQGVAWRFERVFQDLGLVLSPRTAPQDVVIVAIDDRSIAAIGRWPWRRAVHTTLLERLAQAQPRAVLLDLVLSEPDPEPRQDSLLAAAARSVGPVVVPVAWYTQPGQAPRMLEPAGPLRTAFVSAQAESEPDADGILRHLFLRAGFGDAGYPHAALALLQAGGEGLPPHLPLEQAVDTAGPAATAATAATATATPPRWRRESRMPIRYQGPAGHLHRVSYVDVLTGVVPPEALRGRYVLVGMTAVGLGDTHATPMAGPGGSMPGVEVIGQALQALRGGDALRSPPALATAVGSALLVMLLLFSFARLHQRYALVLALGCATLALVGSVLLVAWGWWLTPIGFACSALLAYPLWSWRRLEVTAAALDREIARLDADTVLGQTESARIGWSANDRRVPALVEAGARLRRARRYLAASIDGLPEAVLLADAQGRVTLANRRAAALFEVGEASELNGLSLARLIAEIGSTSVKEWTSRLEQTCRHDVTMVTQLHHADHGDHLVSIVPAPDPDGPRLILTCADIGPLKAAERAREEALAFVSHDLRSPLSSIAMMADIQLRAGPAMAPDMLIAEVQRLAQRGLKLSEDFVRAAQGQSKPMEPVDGDLAELLAGAIGEVAPQALAREHRFELVQPVAGAMRSRFDPELMHRALVNLIGNAIKYSPMGSTTTVTLDAQPNGHLFGIHDQGPGLSAEQLGSLFRAYRRAGASATQAGVGLGLAFVARVAERHGGWVRAHGSQGQGSRFELFVPAPPSPSTAIKG